jgi:uncharacterized OsmC-like protein
VWRSGAHPAVGGVGDMPRPGDLLLAALAACEEVTLRMVAANLGLELTHVEVVAEGDSDPPIRNAVAIGSAFRIEAAGRRTDPVDLSQEPTRASSAKRDQATPADHGIERIRTW